MDIVNLPALPTALEVGSAVIAAAVSGLLVLFTVLIARVPGFGPDDESRNVLMRVLTGVLNLGGLLAFAWTQDVVLTKAQIPVLLITAFGFTTVANLTYVAAKAFNASRTTATADDPSDDDPSAPSDPSGPATATIGTPATEAPSLPIAPLDDGTGSGIAEDATLANIRIPVATVDRSRLAGDL